MRKTLTAIIAALLLILTPAAAHAGGSDSPTPYDVTPVGIQLPGDDTFAAHGHVNVDYYAPGHNQRKSAGVHFDPNNGHPGGAWIGESFIPWAAFDIPEGSRVMWVQIHGYNEHFGEDGGKGIVTGPKPDPSEETRTDTTKGDWEETLLCESWERELNKDIFEVTEHRTSTITWSTEVMDWIETWGDWEETGRAVIDTKTKTEMLDPDFEGCGLPPTGAGVTTLAAGALVLMVGGGLLLVRRNRAGDVR